MTAPIHLLVNPAAANGRAAERVHRAVTALRTIGPVRVATSTCVGDESRLAIEATHARARALVVLGGDGSVSYAARGLIAQQSTVPLAIFAAGTGNDFAKSVGLPSHDMFAMANIIAADRSRVIDAAEIDGVPFVNVAGFGFDVEVLSRVRAARSNQWLRGTALYVSTALQQLFRYREFHAAIDEDEHARPTPLLTVVFANGQWFGGAFRIAPDAQLDDRHLSCVTVAAATPAERVRLFVRALRGAHGGMSMVRMSRKTTFTVRFTERPYFQADGELHQASSELVHIRTLPSALHIVST